MQCVFVTKQYNLLPAQSGNTPWLENNVTLCLHHNLISTCCVVVLHTVLQCLTKTYSRCIVHTAAALSGNNLGQVVHTNVPLFTKQYNLVPCEGLYA